MFCIHYKRKTRILSVVLHHLLMVEPLSWIKCRGFYYFKLHSFSLYRGGCLVWLSESLAHLCRVLIWQPQSLGSTVIGGCSITAIKIQNISMTFKAPCVSSQSVHLYASSEGNPWPAHYHYRSDVFPRV